MSSPAKREPLSTAGATLSGQRVILTAPDDPAARLLTERLRQQGAIVDVIPLIDIRPVPFKEVSEHFDWLFFTSKNGVRSFFGASRAIIDLFKAHPVAVVGPATAQTLESFGLQPAFVSPRFDGNSAAQAFVATYATSGMRILWPCGDRADRRLVTLLEQAGAQVTPLIVYQTHLRRGDTLSESERERLCASDATALEPSSAPILIFTSPSAVQAYEQILPGSLSKTRAIIACLGPKTAESLRERQAFVSIQPDNSTLEGLYDALLKAFPF